MLFYIKWIHNGSKNWPCEVVGNEQSVINVAHGLEEQKRDFMIGLVGQNPCGQVDLGYGDFKHWKESLK